MKNQTSKTKSKKIIQDNEIVCELKQPIWAVINGSGIISSNVSYADAEICVDSNADCTIVTATAASRLNQN